MQVIRALLDSGLIVTTRDGAGRYVELSETYGRELGIHGFDARGKMIADGVELLNADGKTITRMEHPAYVARLSGEAQRLTLGGARSAHGDEVWMVNSYMPLQRDQDGWQVLTVGVPLPRSIFNPPTSATPGAEPFQRALLDYALAVAGKRLDDAALIEALRPAVETIVDSPLSISLVMVRDGHTHVKPILRFIDADPPPPMRLTGESAMRWRSHETFYNPTMGDADVLGNRVVIEFGYPIRSYALIPIMGGCGHRVGAISMTAPVPHAMSTAQRCALEQLAHLSGPVLVAPQACPPVLPRLPETEV